MATNLGTKITSTLQGHLSENFVGAQAGFLPLMLASCQGTPPTTTNTFVHGCLMVQTDTSTGTPAVYQNTGSFATPVWSLFDTALPGDTASSLIDTNSVTALDVGTTASAVNNLRVTNSAAGVVSANAVTLSAVGTDSAISMLIVPKGATGITTIGLSTGTGDIVVGSSSGAQSVKLGNGAGVPTVNIANVSTVGANVNIATAASTAVGNTVNIGTGATTLAGGNVIHIGDGTPTGSGTNLVTIGSIANTANTTTIQGGSGTGAINLTPQTTGTIVIGAAAGTGAITLGSSSTTQTTNVGTGAGVSTVNIGTGLAANVVTIGSTASKTTLKGSPTVYTAINYIATESGSNNAIAGALADAAGTDLTLAAGLRVTVLLAHSLQAGANTFVFNTVSKAIKSHNNPGNDLGTAYVSGGLIDLMYDGTQWQDMSQ